jgi:hypothetical protein
MRRYPKAQRFWHQRKWPRGALVNNNLPRNVKRRLFLLSDFLGVNPLTYQTPQWRSSPATFSEVGPISVGGGRGAGDEGRGADKLAGAPSIGKNNALHWQTPHTDRRETALFAFPNRSLLYA